MRRRVLGYGEVAEQAGFAGVLQEMREAAGMTIQEV